MKDFKPRFITWYEDDFRADRIVARMTPLQRAFTRSLMLECYYNEQRPWLPTDDNKLWLLADAASLEQWLENKDAVLVKFTPVTHSGISLYENKRVLEEWQILEDRLKQRRSAGAASAKARRKRGNAPKAAAPNTTEENTTEQDTTQHNTTLERSTLVERSFNARSTHDEDSSPLVPLQVNPRKSAEQIALELAEERERMLADSVNRLTFVLSGRREDFSDDRETALEQLRNDYGFRDADFTRVDLDVLLAPRSRQAVVV